VGPPATSEHKPMMPDLGDVTIGPGDVMALGRQSLTPGEAPAALVGGYPAEGPVRVSDVSHACGLDDLNAGVGQQVPGLPASAQHPAGILGWRRQDTLLVSGGRARARRRSGAGRRTTARGPADQDHSRPRRARSPCRPRQPTVWPASASRPGPVRPFLPCRVSPAELVARGTAR